MSSTNEEAFIADNICPGCGNTVPGLVPVDGTLKQRLMDAGEASTPEHLCARCLGALTKKISAGAQVFLKEKAKEEQKLAIWKSRVQLIKQGRDFMGQKMYAEAAIAYEKYVRVLEIIYEVPPGGLTPDRLKQAHQNKELTVLASVYWDLLRIYDTSVRYQSRQKEAAKKLGQFIRFTPVFPDIIKKAQSFQRKARNPHVFKEFLKIADSSKSRCFIATSVFESPYSYEVQTLSAYRDQVLLHSGWGRAFTRMYYTFSPSIADFLDRHPEAKMPLKKPLRRLAERVSNQIHY